jgi:hypothetical protein
LRGCDNASFFFPGLLSILALVKAFHDLFHGSLPMFGWAICWLIYILTLANLNTSA